MEAGGVRGQGVHLTKGWPAQSSTNFGHMMSLQRGQEESMEQKGWGVMRLGGRGVHLTTGQTACT